MTTYIKGTFPVRFRRDGKDGVGINSVNTYYALGDSLTVSPSDSKYIYDTLTDVVISTNSGSYVWSGDKIMYTNGNASLTGKYCIGKCSELASVTEQYGTSSSATTEPTSWSDSYPTSLSSGIYIWTRDKIVWKNNTMTYSTAKKVGYIAKDGELGFGIVVSISRDMQYTEAQLNRYFEVGHQDYWFLNSESEKNGCRIGDIFMVSGIATDTKNHHAAYFRCTDNSQSKRLDGISIRHDIVEKGDKGEDAYSYKLRSNISAIPLDNDGYPIATDSSGNKQLILTATIYKGSSSVTPTGEYGISVNIVHKNDTVSNTVNGGSMTIDISKYQNIAQINCTFLKGGTVLDSFTLLPIKAGAAGVSYFPNMCGVWDGANVTYKWTNGSRDMVTFYVGGTPYLFAVKTAGTTIKANVNNATPDKDSRWEKADSPFSMLFANFVYTDNASVAGFVWSEEQMMSSSYTGDGDKTTPGTANIYMNGKKGFFRALNAEIQGKINAKSGTFDNCTINETCVIKGKLVGAYGQFGAWEIAAYGGYDLICKQSVDVLFEMINTKHNTRSIVLRTTNGLSTSQGDGSTDSAPMVRVVTDNGVGGEFTANNSGGYALKAYGYNGATALYVSGLSYFSGNVSMSLSTTIPTISGYLYRDSNGFVKIKI